MNVQEVMSPPSMAMQQLQVSTQYQEQKFFFEIKVAIAKVAPYAVFVGKRISGFRCCRRG